MLPPPTVGRGHENVTVRRRSSEECCFSRRNDDGACCNAPHNLAILAVCLSVCQRRDAVESLRRSERHLDSDGMCCYNCTANNTRISADI